jgi:hypothetical protein
VSRIACDHPTMRTEHNPITGMRYVRCSRCSDIQLAMTLEEFEKGSPLLDAVLNKIRKQHQNQDS